MDSVVCYVPIILIVMFWLGVFIFLKPEKWGLKERSLSYLDRIKHHSEKSPLYLMYKKIAAAGKEEKLLQELSEALAYIKNITVLGRGKSISADFLFEELSEVCPKLSGTFLKMAHYISINDKYEASQALYLEINNSYARDIGEFLAGWEDIPQEDIVNSLDAYRESLRLERNTRLKAKDELISDLIYFPVVLNCMVVLLNFVYVAYFIQQTEALGMLF